MFFHVLNYSKVVITNVIFHVITLQSKMRPLRTDTNAVFNARVNAHMFTAINEIPLIEPGN